MNTELQNIPNVRSVKRVREAISSKTYTITKKTIVTMSSRRTFVVFTKKDDESDAFKVTRNLMSKALQLELAI